MKQKICIINDDLYYITEYFNSSNKYLLWKNRESIAAIIRIEHENCENSQIEYKQTPYSKFYTLNESDIIALELAIKLLTENSK